MTQLPGGASLDQCTVWGNSKGGVYVSGSGEISITDCDIAGNTGGCGLYTYGCNPTVTRTLISRNTALAEGGGVGFSHGNPTFSDCLIFGNTAPTTGGAVWGAWGLATFRNCTIADNSSPGGWDGIYADAGNSGSVVLKNCIVWGHGSQDVRGASDISYTCTQDTTWRATSTRLVPVSYIATRTSLCRGGATIGLRHSHRASTPVIQPTTRSRTTTARCGRSTGTAMESPGPTWAATSTSERSCQHLLRPASSTGVGRS